MKNMIHIADKFYLPIDAVTQTFGILARKGAGKTYTGMKLAEGFAAAGLPFVVMDPLGVWWGLRAAADGKRAGIPIVVIGGAHGDLPLDEGSGAVLAEFVASSDAPIVLDMSDLRKGAMIRFATVFCEALFEQSNRKRRPLHLFVDEAQTFAPQRIDPERARLLGAMEDLVCKGRSRGLGISMMTQRPTMLNKNLLSQVEVLIVLQTAGAHDRKALMEWIEANGTPEESKVLFESLGKLQVGECWIWSPSWLRHLGRHKIAKKWTFDSSRTPKIGERRFEPKKLAKVDLETLREKMTTTIEAAKAKDPAELKRKVARLETRERTLEVQLKNAEALRRAAEERIKEPRFIQAKIPAAKVQKLEVTRRAANQAINAFMVAAGDLEAVATVDKPPKLVWAPPGHKKAAERLLASCHPAPPDKILLAPSPDLAAKIAKAVYNKHSGGNGSAISGSRQKILDSLAWKLSLGFDSAEKAQLAFLSDSTPSSSGYQNNLGAMRGEGLIDYPAPGRVRLLPKGVGMATPAPTPRTDEEIQASVLSKLNTARRKILEILISRRPDHVHRDILAENCGVSSASSGFQNNLGKLRTIGLIVYPSQGFVAPASALFVEGPR